MNLWFSRSRLFRQWCRLPFSWVTALEYLSSRSHMKWESSNFFSEWVKTYQVLLSLDLSIIDVDISKMIFLWNRKKEQWFKILLVRVVKRIDLRNYLSSFLDLTKTSDCDSPTKHNISFHYSDFIFV